MKRDVFRGVLLLAMLTICAIPAGAAQKRPKSPARKPGNRSAVAPAAVGPDCPAGEGVGWTGFRAFLDPETGELREPTPEEARAFSAATDGARAASVEPAESLEVLAHPDGMVSVDLKGRFQQSLVVARNPDGSLSLRCGPGEQKPAPPSRPAAPGAPALEER